MKTLRFGLTLLFAVALTLNLPVATGLASDPDGTLDTTFDGDGKVITSIGTVDDVANIVAIQDDDKIVAAGRAYDGDNHDFMLARYNSDGSLDTTFDGDGKVKTPVGSEHDIIADMAFQTNGKIVVAGHSQNATDWDFALARYNTDGSLDTTFDGDGLVTTAIGTEDDAAMGMAIQTDGKIVVAGYSHVGTNDAFAIARYNTDGSLDTTFDGDGIVTTDIGSGDDIATDMAIQANGSIVAVGRSSDGSGDDFALARYATDGSLDLTFDGDGKVVTPVAFGDNGANGIAIQANGKIVAAGTAKPTPYSDYALTRYETDGSLDITFGGDGIVLTDFEGLGDYGNSVAIQPNGRIVAAGYSGTGGPWDFSAARYNLDGTLDTSFGGDGKVTTAVGSDNHGNSVAIQGDGRIVVAGYLWSASYDLGMVRYTSEGTSPEAVIVSGPSGTTTNTEATFAFEVSGPAGVDTTFRCRLDGQAGEACTSPINYVGLPDGLHTFQVKALVVGGSPEEWSAVRQWTVHAAAHQPDAQIKTTTGTYVGADVYGTTQAVSSNVAPKKTTSFTVLIENDGGDTDTYAISGSLAPAGAMKVSYWDGSTDVTAAVVSGSFAKTLAPAASSILNVKVKAPKSPGVKAVLRIKATSQHDPTKSDAVTGRVTVKG
jgi:uncharacterized delta-60 repeat protein